jgi:hypothetical protein
LHWVEFQNKFYLADGSWSYKHSAAGRGREREKERAKRRAGQRERRRAPSPQSMPIHQPASDLLYTPLLSSCLLSLLLSRPCSYAFDPFSFDKLEGEESAF